MADARLLSCVPGSKSQAQFQSMHVSNKLFTAFIDAFTTNTYIMVIMSDRSIRTSAPPPCPVSPPRTRTRMRVFTRSHTCTEPAATLINIDAARSYFEKFVNAHMQS